MTDMPGSHCQSYPLTHILGEPSVWMSKNRKKKASSVEGDSGGGRMQDGCRGSCQRSRKRKKNGVMVRTAETSRGVGSG